MSEFALTTENATTFGLTSHRTRQLIDLVTNCPRITWELDDMINANQHLTAKQLTKKLAAEIRDIFGS